ncbi:MAG: hypothetical protein JJU41_11170 [Bacteroidetes bacterium]|nr:hypothetical protein [Bacteroidota bacterium]
MPVSYKTLLLYATSGCLLGLSILPAGTVPLSPLAWVAFIPMFFAFKEPVSRGTHLLGAYFFSIIKVFLTLFSFVTVYALPGLILIFLGGLVYSIPLWIYHLLQCRIGWDKSLFVLPFLWTAYITHISDGLLALPILSFSLSQAALPWLIQYIDITGNTAIIFWLVLLNVLFTKSIHSWYQHRKTVKSTSHESVYLAKRVSLIVLCMFLPPLLYAVYTVQVLPQHFTGQIQVGLVQPGFTADETSGEDFGTELFYSQIALSDSMTTR